MSVILRCLILHLYLLCTIAMLREFNHSEFLLKEFGQTTALITELSSYFREPRIKFQTAEHDLECLRYLDKFPLIKEIYLKFNCIFQTEADVERIFSYAGRLFVFHSSFICLCPLFRPLLICFF